MKACCLVDYFIAPFPFLFKLPYAQEWHATAAKLFSHGVFAPTGPSTSVTVGHLLDSFETATTAFSRPPKIPDPASAAVVVDNSAPQPPLASRAAVTVESRGRIPPTEKIIKQAVGWVPDNFFIIYQNKIKTLLKIKIMYMLLL